MTKVIQALEMDEDAVSGVSMETPIDTPGLSRIALGVQPGCSWTLTTTDSEDPLVQLSATALVAHSV